MVEAAVMMDDRVRITREVRASRPDDRRRLAALVHLEPFVHQHPAWEAPLDKAGAPGFVVWEASLGKLDAALAVLRETESVGWVRLFASAAAVPPHQAWEALFPAALEAIHRRDGLRWVAAMPFAEWFRHLLEDNGFYFLENVEVLVWERQPVAQGAPAKGFRLRPMIPADLAAVARVDAAAFGAFWHMSQEAFRVGLSRSVWATVVEEDATGKVVGFQVSTPSPLGGHLARLAVHPAVQGRGIGRWLVTDVLAFFHRNGAEQVTLNTQGNNDAALNLYARMGFRQTEEVYPVYCYDVPAR